MATAFTRSLIRRSLKGAHATQRAKVAIPPLPAPAHGGGYNVFLFFNLESVMGLGHTILGYGPVGEPIETFSFYRHSKKVVAPAEIASLYRPERFDDIVKAGGWFTHGNDGRFWNEHMSCCLAIECSESAYRGMRNYLEALRANPGTYNLITRNCVHIALEALAAGSMDLDTVTGRDLNPVIPRTVFHDVSSVVGARKFAFWAYWFPCCKAPDNGFNTRQLVVDDPSL